MQQRSTEVVQAGERRSAQLESVRAIAALGVLLAHVFAYAHHWAPVIYQGFLHRAIMGGGFGVQLFFALSGYLLYRAFAKRDFGDGAVDLRTYARNRALRILPLYYVVVIVLLLVTQQGGSPTQWWRFLLFFQDYSTKTAQTVDGPMWSLVVEVLFYVVLPIIAWGLARLSGRSPGRAVLLLVGIGACSAALHQYDPAPAVIWSFSFPSTFYGFVPGMVLAIADVTWRGRLPRWLAGATANSDLWVLASVLLWMVIFWRYSLVLLTVPASLLLLGACVLPLNAKNLVRILDWRPLAMVGVVSYSLYLWHVPIIEHLLPHAPSGTKGLLILAVPLSLAAAFLSYALVERTALRFRGRWASQNAPETVAVSPRVSPTAKAAVASDPPPVTKGATAEGLVNVHVPAGVPVREGSLGRMFRGVHTGLLGPLYQGPALAIGAVAFFVRLAVIAATRPLHLGSDPADFDRLGRLLAAGHGFGPALLSPSGGPTAFRAPLYPLFLAAVYKVTGDSITAARLVQALLGVVTVALIGFVAYLIWGRRTALVAAGIAAVFPTLVIYSTALLSESIFLPLETLAVAAALLALKQPERKYRWWIVSGLAAGLGVLARPNGAALVVGLMALAFVGLRFSQLREGLRRAAVVGVVAVLVVTPWEIRTVSDFHEVVMVSTIDGYNLAGVYNAQAAGDGYPIRYAWRPPTAVPSLAPMFHDARLNEATLGDKLWRQGSAWIEHHPLALPTAMAWNTFRMAELAGLSKSSLSDMHEAGFGRRAAVLEMTSFWMVAAVGLLGLCTRRIRRAPLVLWALPALMWLISVPFLGTARIRAPIDPFLVIAAAVAVVAIADRWVLLSPRRRPAMVARAVR